MNTTRKSSTTHRSSARKASVSSRGRKSSTGRSRRGSKSPLTIVLMVLAGVAAAALLFFGGRFTAEKVGEAKEGVQIQETLTEAQYAIENVDAKSLLNVIDPDVADPIRLLLATTGVNGNEAMAQVMTSLFGDGAFDTAQGALEDVQIEVTDSQILGKNAKLETLWTMNINGSEFFRYVTIRMEKINKKWYIVDFSVNSRSAVA
mgnify:FL=1